jgi:uncharacterized protein
MVATQQQAMEVAKKARQSLEQLYGPRLRGVYLYGSGARDQLTPESDIDLAIILDRIDDRSAEHRHVSRLGADLSLEFNTVVLFFFVEETDFEAGRFAIHRAIKDEGIAA